MTSALNILDAISDIITFLMKKIAIKKIWKKGGVTSGCGTHLGWDSLSLSSKIC